MTIAVEPAGRRLERVREVLGINPALPPFNKRLNRRINSLVPWWPRGGRWVVTVEADDGRRARVTTPSHHAAMELARDTWHDVRRRGAVALADLR